METTKLNIKRETEKAVLISAILECYVTNQSVKADFWCPKSIIKNDEIPQWFINKKEDELRSFHSHYGNGGRTLKLVY